MKDFKNIGFFILTLIFAFALMFAFVELPASIDSLLQSRFGFPGFDQGSDDFNSYKSELFISTLYLRWIGYASIFIIIFFIAFGFLTKRSGWAWAGAFVLFIPVFGQFALSMFFLAGLGMLRVIWLPFMDISFAILQLGNVVLLPYWILMRAAGLLNWNAHIFISYCFMLSGAFLFVWGVLVWLQNRFGEKGFASGNIYKLSRHPQYAGWIIWSYGIMLFSLNLNTMKKSWGLSSSLPWLLASMVIVGICFIEEIKMKEKYGDEYEKYRKRTSFLVPVPKLIKSFINIPAKLFLKEEFPSTKMQAAGVTSLYTAILILLSLFWVDFGTTDIHRNLVNKNNPELQVDSLITEIRNSSRRSLSSHFNGLKSLGAESIDALTFLLYDSNAVIREFSADALGELRANNTDTHLIRLLDDDNFRVRNSAAISLGKMKSGKAINHFLKKLNESPGPGMRYAIYSALGEIGTEEAWNILISFSGDTVWFSKNSLINALCRIDAKRASNILTISLSDKDMRVRRNSIYLILKYKIKNLKKEVRNLLGDEDFETRFYAKIILEQL